MMLSLEDLNINLTKYLTSKTPDHVVVVTSKFARQFCLNQINHLTNFNVIEVENGEASKTLQSAAFVWEKLLEFKVNRKSMIIAVGGGSVLDLAGFCASTFMRGIPIIYIPTTLLSMVDSAEGGKTGINFKGVKNIIGTFQQADIILNCPTFIQTLPQLEILSGWAEMMKHGILEGHSLWKTIQNGIPDASDPIWNELIEQNIQFKQKIVQSDFKEAGPRKLLNLGHTVGHALEALKLNDPEINHGICVANGIMIESLLAFEIHLCTADFLSEIQRIFNRDFPKITYEKSEIPELLELIKVDKKNDIEGIKCTLPNRIGDVEYDVIVPIELIEKVLLNWISV
jgi:3-dehydroquinate synthase